MVQVLNVSLTADGSTWDFQTISVSVKFISATKIVQGECTFVFFIS